MNAPTGSHLTFNDDQSIPWSAAINHLRFQKRTCTTFIPKETNRECCVCNYDHSESNKSQFNETWNWKVHTTQEATDCYGMLPPSNSPYLRCDIETDLEQLCFMLLGVWSIVVPGLIMRMIGDTDSTPSIKTEKELLQGISDVAVVSDTWIITSGYKEESISELVGEAIYDCRIKNPGINFNAIAVGKWGNIHNCHKLEHSNADNQSTTHKGHGQYKLESNHTHYIFFDDGTCDSLDTGKFASDLARQISCGAKRKIPLITVLVGGTFHSLPSICTDLKNRIPVVIVNGCGPLGDILCKYLKLTETALLAEDFFPSYDQRPLHDSIEGFYQSSNGVNQNTIDQDEAFSDSEDGIDIAMIDEVFSEDDAETSSSSTGKTLREVLRALDKCRLDFVNEVRKLYSIVRQQHYEAQGKRLPVGELLNLDEEKSLGKCLYQMANCLQNPFRKNIHVFNTNSSKSLKETIYYAFVQARDNLSQTKKKYYKTIDEQVHLALRWGIDDMAENQSAVTSKIWNDTTKISQNRLFLIDALSKNMLAFVMNFVKLDIDFTILFGPTYAPSKKGTTRWSHKYHYLQELYSDTKRKNCDSLYLLDQISAKLNFTEQKHLVIVLEKLVGNIMHPLYKDQSQLGLLLLAPEKDTDAEYIYRDLFLWCVLTCRLDMAEIFLSQMKTRICSALIASKILKSLAAYAPDQVAKDTLYSKADYFETHAIEFVRCAYANDKYQACELIMRRIDLYGDITCLQMAIAADDKKFLHEDACQALLTNIWYDKVDPVRERNRLIINILTLGISQFFISIYDKRFFGYFKIKHKSHVIHSTQPKRKLEKTGIDYTDDYDINQTVLQHFWHFHNRPVVKYCYSGFGYILFLFFFSYYMLFAFVPPSKSTPSIHWAEIITIITATTMLFEEVRQFFSQDDRSLMGKIRAYFDLRNRISNLCLVVPAYLLFYIGLLLRFTQKNPENFVSARIVMALDLELWYIRSILFIGISSHLGPKIVMIRKMTNDLLVFIIVIVVFIFGYGITSRSLTAYGEIDLSSRQFFYNVIYPVYYFVHGSFDNERAQLEAKQDTATFVVTKVMFAFHMLFVNILLLNLLIALFSFTINDIQTQARYVWAYDRCEIVHNYHARPALCPPFTFLISIVQFCQWCWRRIYKNRCVNGISRDEESSCFKMIPINDNVDHAWSEFERYSTNGYIRQLLHARAAVFANGMTTDIMSESSSANPDELKRIKYLINDLKENLEFPCCKDTERLTSVESAITDLQSRFGQMENRFDRWSKSMKEIKTSLNWMMTTMSNAKMSESEPPPPLIQEIPSRDSSVSQIPRNDTTRPRTLSNQQSVRKNIMTPRSSLQQKRPTTPEVRLEMDDELNKNRDD